MSNVLTSLNGKAAFFIQRISLKSGLTNTAKATALWYSLNNPLSIKILESLFGVLQLRNLRIENMMHETDHMTFKMHGHGWEGVRPFHMLEEFV